MIRSVFCKSRSCSLKKFCVNFARQLSQSPIHTSTSSKPILDVLSSGKENDLICVQGWIRSIRYHKGITFIHLNDGSSPRHLQVVLTDHLLKIPGVAFASCLQVEGKLVKSPGAKQMVELVPSSVIVVGSSHAAEFPIKEGKLHTPQYLRQCLHVRPKTNSFSSLLRIRNAASMSVHEFFQSKNYVFIHTPILTTNNAEGAGKVFKVEASGKDVHESDEEESDDQIVDEDELLSSAALNQDCSDDEAAMKHFFNTPAYLTVSGQLHLECISGAFKKVYNFGPTFRVEGSKGPHHLSEFYMIEAELSFIKRIEALMEVIEELVKYIYFHVLDHCSSDVDIYHKYIVPDGLKHQLELTMNKEFARISYDEAIEILRKSKTDFRVKPEWGIDLKKDHERYITDYLGNSAVFITDFPSTVKPFYARRNDDNRTVAACDLLLPRVGEACGASLREERYDILEANIEQEQIGQQLQWYLDLRKFGACPHGGFGLGFERILSFILGAHSLKDVIPFPRWSGRCRL